MSWRILYFAIWLLRRVPSGAVQAVRTMSTKPLNPGSVLNVATWNCGGLSFTQKELCRELNYDIPSLTETHNSGKLKENKNFLVSDPAPKNDSFSRVGLLLSDRLSRCVTFKGTFESRIVYARIRARPCNMFVAAIYMPHVYRGEPPYFNDTLKGIVHYEKTLIHF